MSPFFGKGGFDTDVLIVGGGPAGLVAAIAARRKGFRVMVADPIAPPHDKACGEGLMPEALGVAQRLGIEFPAGTGFPLDGIRFIGRHGSVDANFRDGPSLAIRRTVLHSLLAQHAERNGVELLWGRGATGLDGEGVRVGDQVIRSRWVVGADGGASGVRRWAGLDHFRSNHIRFGFRRHYAISPWTSHVEIHWGDGCQIYITPVSGNEIGVAVLSRDSHLRVSDALVRFPELQRRLATAEASSQERGGVSAMRQFQFVTRDRVALIGDASGSVDAITGDGITLAFRQSEALAEAFEADDLNRYESAHRRLFRRPAFMGNLLLTMDRFSGVRALALRALVSKPALFSGLLELHTCP